MKDYKYLETIKNLSKKGSVMGIETMKNLLDTLDHPEEDLKIVHCAGTNGKGSTLAFLSGILVECGYKVGRYISPTIFCYEERFQINGIFIEPDRLETYFAMIEEASAKMEANGMATPTAFEAETAIALLYFKEEAVDYALIECGMGGLMDATNAIECPYLSIITSISEDHKAVLGNTLEEIAKQKAGIIKPMVPVVLGCNDIAVRKVVVDAANAVGSVCEEISREDINIIEETPIGTTFSCGEETYKICLPGRHQVENAMTALFASRILSIFPGGEQISDDKVKEGLFKTRWPGRLELLATNPAFYMDGAHNPDAALRLSEFLEKHFTNKKIVYIMGVLGDKEYDIMLTYLMPLASEVFVFTPNNARGLDANKLAKTMEPYHVPVTVCDGVCQAVETALASTKDVDCYVLCGSLSFMEEFRRNAEIISN